MISDLVPIFLFGRDVKIVLVGPAGAGVFWVMANFFSTVHCMRVLHATSDLAVMLIPVFNIA
jgi:hypothetical protein